MATFNFPLPLPIANAGVTTRHFRHASAAHGAGHVNRVIFLALFLARSSGLGELTASAWAAAHLHDLARRHDGPCELHGQWAIAESLPTFLSLYRSGGLDARHLPGVCTAVAMHCRDAELPRDHPHFQITALLKDADALDRVRFGDIDPARLRLERSRDIVPFAAQLFRRTSPTASLQEVWDAATHLIAESLNVAKPAVYHWNESEAPLDRRHRRLQAAKEHPRSVVPHQLIWANQTSLEQVGAAIQIQLGLGVPRELLHAIHAKASRLVPFTATRALRGFLDNGFYKSFWEAGPSWHTRYSDDPEAVRRHQCARLFGEADAFVAYGCLLDPHGVEFPEQVANMRAAYGPDIIEWKSTILDSATFCLNDSQKQPCVLPFSREAWAKASLLHSIAVTYGVRLPIAVLPFRDTRIHFWEFQTHRKLVLADMAGLVPDKFSAAA